MAEGDEVYVLVVRSRTVPDPLQLPEGWEVVMEPFPLAPRFDWLPPLLAQASHPESSSEASPTPLPRLGVTAAQA